MAYIGDFRLGDTLDFHFTTRQISGAPATLASSPVLSCYVGNSTTEITAGITLDVDFDSRTGLNHVRIVASSGNGYATASNYSVVITTGTVNSVSVVGEVIGNFSIEARSAIMPVTAARPLLVDANGVADARLADAVAHGGTLGSSTATLALSRANITSQSSNTSALTLLGNGTGHGLISTSGSGATGNGIVATAASTNGSGFALTGTGSGSGLLANTVGVTSTFIITGATTFTGAITATNASNDIRLGATQNTATGAAVWATVMDGTNTALQVMRGFIAALLGKSSGLDVGTPTYRNIADSKDVITSVGTADGNRTSVTLDLT